jgi:hypothetical protein
MTKNILELSALEIREAARTFLLPLFTPVARTAIAVSPEKSIDVQEAFSRLPHPLKAKLSFNITIRPEAFLPMPSPHSRTSKNNLSSSASSSVSSDFSSKESRRHWLMAGPSIGHPASHHALGMLPSPPSICSDSESTCSSSDGPRVSDAEAPSGSSRRRRLSSESDLDGAQTGASGIYATVMGLDGESIGGKAVGFGMMAVGAAVAFTAFAVQASSNNSTR